MKPLFFISAPVDTWSGYGARSRDIIKALLKLDKYNIKIIPQRWGNTPFGFLKIENPEHKLILDCIWNQPQLPTQPDIWMQITVPNEFQPIGKFNIGLTAGIETTLCDASWIEGINRMNLVLVSSEHAKKVFLDSKFEKRDKTRPDFVEKIETKVPIEVLFEGINTDIYNISVNPENIELKNILNEIPEDFNYLFVGHWLQGDLGQDRKDVGMLIKTFLETFKNKKNKPGLILKTSSSTYSIMDRDSIIDKIQKIRTLIDSVDLPNIYLLHGELEDYEMNELYNHPKIKTHISFTKGEGFGRPLLEASISQKPVIAPEWSGQLDFLDKDKSILLPGSLTQIHPSAVVKNMLLSESAWFTVDYKKASEIIEDVFKNYKNYLEGAKRQAYISRTEFSLEKMSEKINLILTDKVPQQMELKIPQLNKIKLPKITKSE